MAPAEPGAPDPAGRGGEPSGRAVSRPPVRVDIIGIGCGDPGHLTLEAVAALGRLDAVLLTDKRSGDDPLVGIRESMLDQHAPQARRIVVHDPPRERRPEQVTGQDAYEHAVAQWHQDRAAVHAEALRPYAGRTVGVLVWGDPAFYDSALRILHQVNDLGVSTASTVIPGISAVQLLAARHRLVLNDVGSSVTITTGRRLAEHVEAGADNLVVMLNRDLDTADLPGGWSIWWGGNLGTPQESLISGDLHTAAALIRSERARLRDEAGWIMDIYLLRRRAADPEPNLIS